MGLLGLHNLLQLLIGVIGVMDLRKNLQRLGQRLVVADELILVRSRMVECFQSVQLRSVVVSMELAIVTMFVSKQASLAVWTHYFSIEGAAIF